MANGWWVGNEWWRWVVMVGGWCVAGGWWCDGGRGRGPIGLFASGWAREARYRAGPGDKVEMFDWAKRLLDVAKEKAPGHYEAFRNIACNKFLVSSDYSGMLCFEMALRELCVVAFETDGADDDHVLLYRACDKDKVVVVAGGGGGPRWTVAVRGGW